ncbi:MAG: T9SS type A sorting domain-containing protein [Flavobacteriales bacterium]|nr:T9SS type A sorting domain-containing protein [Flavobacteriales bacterium]
MMRTTSLLLCLLPLLAGAQVTHIVHVGGNTSGGDAPYYLPDMLTIDIGDTVRWVKDNGTHNVYGELDDFPNNPEGFSSGTPSGTIWPYSYVFTIPGTYGYHCTQQGHAATQHGMVVVLNTIGINASVSTSPRIRIHPNPATNMLMVQAAGSEVRSWEVFDMDGRMVVTSSGQNARPASVPVAHLSAGTYFLRVHFAGGGIEEHRFTKE